MPHLHHVKVRFYELDPYGHLNHSVYVQLFETGRIELLDKANLGLPDLEKVGFRFIVSKIETKFLISAIGLAMILDILLENRLYIGFEIRLEIIFEIGRAHV